LPDFIFSGVIGVAMKVKIKSSEIVILLLVSLMSFAANLPSQLVDNILDKKLLLLVLTASVVIALFHYLRLMLFLAIVILAIGANLPQEFAVSMGINPKIMLAVLGFMVTLALLNYVFRLMPTGVEENTYEALDTRYELLAAIFRGDLARVSELLAMDIDVNFYEEGLTPLHLAAEKGYPDIVRMLLDRGADINALNIAGQRPIEIAIDKRFVRSTDILFKAEKIMTAEGAQ
jgi:Ankyrin repeats (many copies)